MPAAQKMNVRTSVSSSRRSAPAMRSTRSPQLPDAAGRSRRRSVASARTGTSASRDDAGAEQAEEQDERRAAEQREQRREPGPVDVRALDLRLRQRERDAHGVPRAALGGGRRLLRGRHRAVTTDSSPCLQRELRVEREREDREHERHEHEAVAQRHLPRRHRRADAVVHRADEQPQRVDARQHDAGEGDDREHDLRLEDAEQDQELADEVRRARHRERRRASRSGTARRARARGTRGRPCRAGPPSRRRARRAAPTMKNAGATTSPWLTACRIAPCAPSGRSAKIPSTMKPSWATDE